MSVFTHLPLGQRIPAGLHGVSCSLPTMRAVIGYEEKHPDVVSQMTSGYPRFVQHPLLKQASSHLLSALGISGHSLWLTSSHRAAKALRAWLGENTGATVVHHGGLSGVHFPTNPDVFGRAKTFLQHTGMLLPSREAEDYLVRVGELPSPSPEPSFDGYPGARVKGAVLRAFGTAAAEDTFLANSGMNAIYAAFRAVDTLQRAKGRRIWIQLGWLYLDTIAILQKFTVEPVDDYVHFSNVFDLEGLRKFFAEKGTQVAGLIAEVPTNPLIQTPDLPALYELCRAHDVALVVDPTIASPHNIDVLPYADLVVNSLTKYAASEGDVLMGAVVVNPHGRHATELRRYVPEQLEPVYSRDVARLATQIGDYENVINQINRTAPKVIEFLRAHPKIKELYWSLHPDSKENYLRLARSPESVGSIVSFVVDGPLAEFYDRLRLPKGPSFGMKMTLICPFIYLAHYDLVTSEAGRIELARNGLDPELLRLSIGCEPAEEIIGALAEALA